MTEDRPEYQSYLLRLWPAKQDGEKVWRASLQRPQNSERVGFASLDELFDFLRLSTGQSGEDEGAAGEEGGG
jgi:hypothetical protein